MTSQGEQRHNALPHFHLGCDADHAHGHSHHGHSHPHPAPLDSAEHSHEDQQPFNSPLGSDHDQNAIYVSELDITSTNSAPRVTGAELAEVVAVCDFVWTTKLWLSPSSLQPWHPPDKVLDASETFLTLRNLRI